MPEVPGRPVASGLGRGFSLEMSEERTIVIFGELRKERLGNV